MANEVVGVQIKVDSSQATQSLGSVRKEIKQANSDLLAAQKQFGDYSAEAIAAAKKVAQLKDSIQEARETADLFDPGKKFQAFAGAASAVAGGFAAVQGALGLVGVKSEEVEKSILKVQSALALSQGLSSVADSAKDFQRLAAVVKTQVVTAFSTLRGAIIATGVGALAVGIGLLIANFDAVKKAVLNLIPGLGKVADFIGGLINKVTDFVGITSEAGRATEKLIKDNEKAIKDSERFLDLNADKYDEYTQRKIKANLEFKKKQNEFLKDEELSETQRNEFIRQAREKANREILKSDEDRNEKVKSANKKAAEDAKAAQKKAAEDAKLAREAELLKVVAGRLNEEGLLAEIDNRRKESIKSIDPIIATQANLQAKVIGDRVALETQAAALINAESEKSAKAVVTREQAKIDAYRMTGEALGALGQLVGQETAAGKTLASAQALINTYLGITQIWANDTIIPEPFGTIQKVAATITAAASGLAAVRNINRTAVPGFGGGGGVSAPSFSPSSAPIAPATPQAALTQLNQQSINQLSSATNRAYVVESDVTNSQERVTRINRAARLA
jgi:hypothetical protein